MTPPTDEREKSVRLARALGWSVVAGKLWTNIYPPFEGYGKGIANLYDPANMALAWRVLNWADTQRLGDTQGTDVVMWSDVIGDIWWGELPPAQAQAAWLDKVLELAIEAGLVEVEDA